MIYIAIESPYYAGSPTLFTEQQKYLYDILKKITLDHANYFPFASHAYFTNFLDDSIDSQRQIGINRNLYFQEIVSCVCFFMDYGMSSGMIQALEKANKNNKQVGFYDFSNDNIISSRYLFEKYKKDFPNIKLNSLKL